MPQTLSILGEPAKYAAVNEYCKAAGLELPENEEGYCLLVDENKVAISAHNEAGLFYGITTLVQLIKVKNGNLYFKGAQVVDYPTLKFRGIHCLSGRDAGDQIAKTIRNLIARFKLNALVFECEYMEWDNAPEVKHPTYSMSKADAKKVVDEANKYPLELIPLIQSLGHSEWIFTNGQNLDIAEDPETPYAYNPTNPATYDFIFKIYQEALDFFNPKTFHIGHDEVTMARTFPIQK